eukprot:403376439
MLVEAFDFSLGHSIPHGQVTIGKFDGKNPSIAFATTGGKVLIYSPYGSNNIGQNDSSNQAAPTSSSLQQQQNAVADFSKSKEIKALNTNKEIIAMCCGTLNPAKDNEMLFIGSKTNLMVYDVENNCDVFDKEVSDGVNCLTFGTFPEIGSPLILAGGNCSITGFDYQGEERFWTVTGDNATALEFMDWDEQGDPELLAGSDDFSIRVFKQEEILQDINENSKIQFIKQINHKCIFGYSLMNGAFGVYHGKKRLWRQKGKEKVSALVGVDYDIDGQYLLIIGYQSGLIEARKHRTGELMHKTAIGSSGNPIANLFYYDFRQDGSSQIIAVDTEGNVKGLSLTRNVKQFQAMEIAGDQMEVEVKQIDDAFTDLNQQKLELIAKIEAAKDKAESKKVQKKEQVPQSIHQQQPIRSEILITQMADPNSTTCILTINLRKPGWIIKSVILQNDALFEGSDTHVVYPSQSVNQIQIPLKADKNQELIIDIKVLMGAGLNSSQFLIHHEPRYVFRRFSMFKYLGQDQKILFQKPESQVMFVPGDRYNIQNVADWAAKSFILNDQGDLKKSQISFTQSQLTLKFLDARSSLSLIISAIMSGAGLQITFQCDSMETCGDLVQDLCLNHLKISELESTCQFPIEMQKLQEILSRIEESNQLKTHFSANISDNINNLKVQIVKAEASLMINDIESMKRSYALVQQENTSLIGEYLKRSNNHQGLISTLKELNAMIKNSGNLRIGQAQKKVIAEARDSIKTNTASQKMAIILQRGSALRN